MARVKYVVRRSCALKHEKKQRLNKEQEKREAAQDSDYEPSRPETKTLHQQDEDEDSEQDDEDGSGSPPPPPPRSRNRKRIPPTEKTQYSEKADACVHPSKKARKE